MSDQRIASVQGEPSTDVPTPHPQTSAWKLATVLAGQHSNFTILRAMDEVRKAHPEDFDLLLPIMEFMAPIFGADWSRILPAEVIECLYCIVKHATFAAGSRETLLRPAAKPN